MADEDERAERCGTCKFYEPPDPDDGFRGGQCHHGPPTPNLAELVVRALLVMENEDAPDLDVVEAYCGPPGGVWPEVWGEEWCGEWKAKET